MKIIDTILSLIKITLKSKFFLNTFHAAENSVVIVGNGPSAKAYLDNFKFDEKMPTLCVNMFAATPSFSIIKPKYYLMSDHAFLDFSEEVFNDASKLPRLKKQPDFLEIQELINSVWESIFSANWELIIFVPQIYRNTFIVNFALNKNTKIQFYNYTVVKGYTGFENFIYKKKLGSPQSQNVINSCIFQSINSGFKNIYLVGVDNNFHLNMIVDETNQLQHVDDHFYKVNKKTTPQLHVNGTSVKMHEFFLSLHKAFYTHHRLQQYAEYMGVKIYNATKGSFIDAYPRKEIQ
jgi:hypothetical protein